VSECLRIGKIIEKSERKIGEQQHLALMRGSCVTQFSIEAKGMRINSNFYGARTQSMGKRQVKLATHEYKTQ